MSINKKILIVGGGRWAKVYHKEIFKASELFDLDLCILSRTKASDLNSLNQKTTIYSSFTDLPIKREFDLTIIATSEEYHLRDYEQIAPISKKVLIEKPIFMNSNQFKIAVEVANKNKIPVSNVYMSCPFLFARNVRDFLQIKNHQIKFIDCVWSEPAIHPSHYRYDNHVGMTAISHLLPIVLNACEFNDGDQILDSKVSKTSCSFQIKKVNIQEPINIKIDYSRSRGDKFEKRITFQSGNELKSLNLMSQSIKLNGIEIVEDKLFSPLCTQVLSLLMDQISCKLNGWNLPNLESLASVFFLLEESNFNK